MERRLKAFQCLNQILYLGGRTMFFMHIRSTSSDRKCGSPFRWTQLAVYYVLDMT